jgi:hypothetical protein
VSQGQPSQRKTIRSLPAGTAVQNSVVLRKVSFGSSGLLFAHHSCRLTLNYDLILSGSAPHAKGFL